MSRRGVSQLLRRALAQPASASSSFGGAASSTSLFSTKTIGSTSTLTSGKVKVVSAALKNNNTTPDRPTACDDISIVAEAFLNANADWMNSDGLTSIDSNGWTWAMAGARKPALDEPVNYEVIYVSDGGYDYYIVTSELSINLGVVDTKIDYSDADFMNLLNMYNGAALVSVAKKFNILVD